MISFVTLKLRLDANALKSGELTFGFPFTTTLQHTSLFRPGNFLTNFNVTPLEYPTHTSDLVPADFYQFPGLKSTLKGRPFCDATTAVKNGTEEPKRLSQNGF
jgi:hypothetical protein